MEEKITVKDDFKTMERIVYKDGKKIISITALALKKSHRIIGLMNGAISGMQSLVFTEETKMAETCKACGKSWTEHLGVEPTCALLQEAIAILKNLGEPTTPGVFSTYGSMVCKVCGYPLAETGHQDGCVIERAQKFIGLHLPLAGIGFASASENLANSTR